MHLLLFLDDSLNNQPHPFFSNTGSKVFPFVKSSFQRHYKITGIPFPVIIPFHFLQIEEKKSKKRKKKKKTYMDLRNVSTIFFYFSPFFYLIYSLKPSKVVTNGKGFLLAPK